MVYKKLKKNIVANAFVDFPETEVGEDLLRIERKADINTNEINKTNNNVANNTQAIEELKPQVQTNQESIEELKQEASEYAKLGEANTFSANNTFSGDSTFKKMIVKGTNNNQNYVLIDNFDWNNKNYSVVKLVKEGTKNLLQLEAINNDNGVAISAPSATSFTIQNLSNPTQANQAANKSYVDNVIKKVTINISQMGKIQDFANGNMRYILLNYNLMGNNQINYDRVVGITFVNKSNGEVRLITSYCVYENGWIELQVLNTNSPSAFSIGGHIYVWYK